MSVNPREMPFPCSDHFRKDPKEKRLFGARRHRTRKPRLGDDQTSQRFSCWGGLELLRHQIYMPSRMCPVRWPQPGKRGQEGHTGWCNGFSPHHRPQCHRPAYLLGSLGKWGESAPGRKASALWSVYGTDHEAVLPKPSLLSPEFARLSSPRGSFCVGSQSFRIVHATCKGWNAWFLSTPL